VPINESCLVACLTSTIQYHCHLFVLDNQVHHLDSMAIVNYGSWLGWHWEACQARKAVCLQQLMDLGLDFNVLRGHWADQVTHQTRPLPRECLSLIHLDCVLRAMEGAKVT
jgi:hypothetical protein